MAYRLNYSDYSTSEGPPNPSEWVGPPGPVGPVGPQGVQGVPGEIADVLATGSTTPRSIEDRESDVANVLDYGAGLGGDDAAAIRAAIASGKRVILVPPGTYTCKSTEPTFGSATNPSCFEIANRQDTWIIAYGATFLIDNSISGPVPTTTLSFTNNSKNVGILGGTFVGNQTGLAFGAENVGINFCSVTAMTVRDVKFTGTFLASIAGVYAFDSVFDNCQGFANLNAIDVAHLENVVFRGCRFQADTAQPVAGLNLHYDVPTLSDNVVTTEGGAVRSLRNGISNDVRVFDCVFQGFGNGIAIDAIVGANISRTIIRDGLQASSPYAQAGILIYTGDAAVSAGQTTSNLDVSDCDIYGNGVTAGGGTGAGIYIGSAIGTIANVNIINNRIYNNTNSGVGTASLAASISGLFIAGNDFKPRGGSGVQANAIHPTLAAALQAGLGFAYDNDGSASFGARDPVTYGTNNAISWMDGAGTPQPVLGMNSSNITFMRPGSTFANIQFQNYAGATLLTVNSGANNVSLAVPAVLGGGISCGAVDASSADDLSKHIALYSNAFGFSVGAGRLNYVITGAASHCFRVNGTDAAIVNSSGVATQKLEVGGSGGPSWTTGSAAPSLSQPVGSLYSRTGGAVGATLYVSRGGGTWAAVAGV